VLLVPEYNLGLNEMDRSQLIYGIIFLIIFLGTIVIFKLKIILILIGSFVITYLVRKIVELINASK